LAAGLSSAANGISKAVSMVRVVRIRMPSLTPRYVISCNHRSMALHSMTRRTWIASTAGSIAAAAPGKFTHPIGAELYTVRNVITKQPEETLKRIADVGYGEVETGRDGLDQIAPTCRKLGLKIPACHMEIPLITGKWPDGKPKVTLAQAIDSAKKHGVEYLVFPYLPPAERGDADSYRRLADQLNEAGRQCKAAGLQLAYHNHAFEFDKSAGQRPIEIMLERFDKTLVGFEVDVFWVSTGGDDPVAFLKRLSGRVPLLHLKDRGKGCAVVHQESAVKRDCFKEIGAGTLDFADILRTAESIGVKHYFVEQDQTPGDPVESLAQSYRFLRNLVV
jgi:sugar phosphate isomerase/epimerase